MRNIILVSICVFSLSLLGCGGGKIATNMVEGTVVMDGAPLAGATVTFSPTASGAGMIAVGRADEAGKFTLQTQLGEIGKGTTEGEYTITVSKVDTVPTGKTVKNDADESVPEVKDKQIVPEIYLKAQTSPLKHTIVKGKNTVTLELSSKP